MKVYIPPQNSLKKLLLQALHLANKNPKKIHLISSPPLILIESSCTWVSFDFAVTWKLTTLLVPAPVTLFQNAGVTENSLPKCLSCVPSNVLNVTS